MLDKFLGSLKLPKWFELGDNELRYMLWRSKERLERGKEHPIDVARDIVKREELGLDGETRYRDPDEIDDILEDGSLGLQERITASAARLANNHSSDKRMRNDAMRAIGENLQDLQREIERAVHGKRKVTLEGESLAAVRSMARHDYDRDKVSAAESRRRFDMSTVKRVADLARVLITTGYINNASSGEIKRLLSAVKNSAGQEDIEGLKIFHYTFNSPDIKRERRCPKLLEKGIYLYLSNK